MIQDAFGLCERQMLYTNTSEDRFDSEAQSFGMRWGRDCDEATEIMGTYTFF